ncbi:hypothetical protein [Caballeronia ptereochthonis]|jgi:hypothetical protein|uniref:Uncharacterized protein n=1 Tax=Caballeronia ptereochthonis TaxID=1777144 RepID=A0A158DIX3_9BURK|nr:hypothetical protein [Caballeronia ptereochthonis]SAK93757.1 hypothetical protein AWB83_05437 [Caballeronia ptereochthonis]
MIQELTLDAPVRLDPDFLEFTGSLDGRRQVFRVDAGVFRELLQVRRIGEASMKNLFMADAEHFLLVATRKLASRGQAARRFN